MIFKKITLTLILIIFSNNIFSFDEEKVIVYNWDDYIPEGILEDFTKETGITVEYSTYSSSIVMYSKLQILRGRGYDVIIPSTDFVDKMAQEGLLQPINKSLISNFYQLDESLLDKHYDPKNKYSIPYLWGSTGIAVNGNSIDAKKIKYWKDLWDSKWKNQLLVIDDMRGIFHMALKINGHSTNSVNTEEIEQAYNLLKGIMGNIKTFSADMLSEDFVNIGALWNGDAAQAKLKNPAIQYIYPKEGALFWIDSFVIPAQALNVSNAHKFIDFMIRADIAARCVNELQYATPNRIAKNLLSQKIQKNSIIFPPAKLLKNSEFQRDVGDKLELYNLYWNDLRSNY